MKKFIIMSLLATILISEEVDVNNTIATDVNITNSVDEKVVKYPKVYNALGNIIYGSVDKIERLKSIELFESFSEKIDNYTSEVDKARATGFEIESGNKEINKLEYLNRLRELSKEHDFFIRSVKSAYSASLKKEDSKLFSQIVNSGLLNTEKEKENIIEYYLSHSEDINASGIIQKYLDEDAKLKSKRKSYSYEQAKRLREEAKIRRIREDDERKQAELEKSLAEEVKQKKLEIRENQKKELFN